MLLLSDKIFEEICETNSLTSRDINALIAIIGCIVLYFSNLGPKATYHQNWVNEIDSSLLIGRDVISLLF